MKRFLISISVVLIVLSLGLGTDVALAQAKKDLNQAAVDGDLDRVKALVGEGSNVNEKNRMGMTPLIVAAMNSRTPVCEFLVANGADVNAKDSRGQTALYFAVDRNNKELVELLVKKGADVNATSGRGENAFSLAKKKGNTEIVDFLSKNGGTDPVVSGLYGEEYYGDEAMGPGGPATTSRTGATRSVAQTNVQVDLLADPNEIQARLKTFGLEKDILTLATKSKKEMGYWAQTRYDNRTSLAREVQKQLDEEFALVRKIAVEEKASKTTEALDTMLEKKKERDSEVKTALMQQRREAMAANQSSRGGRSRGSTRSSGRSSGRGYSSGYGAGSSSGGYVSGGRAGGGSYGAYDETGGMSTTGRGRSGRVSAREQEPLDPDTQEEIRIWEQAAPDKKVELAKSLHTLTYGDFAYIRGLAVEEEAKKTTAAIDGILLSRQVRLDTYVKAAELLKSTAAQNQAGAVGDPRTQQGVRSSRGRTRGGMGGTQQQQMQGGRTRRRR